MRDFSDFEKDILSKMVALQNEGKLCRYNLFCKISNDLEVQEIDRSDIQIVSDSINENEIRKILIQLSFLFIYLENNYYLIDFKRDLDNKIELKKEPSKKYMLKTDRTYQKEYFIYRFNCFYELSLSETIVDLVNNNFKTVEQRRFEKQLSDSNRKFKIQLADNNKKYKRTICWTRASFLVALIAVIVSLIIPFCVSTKIDESQIDEIKFELRDSKIKSAVPIQNNDTVQVNIVNKDLIIKK